MTEDRPVLHVGCHPVPIDEARKIVETYTQPLPERPSRKDFYAWPYYDHYESGSNANALNDGDLLAPVLLNVDPGIHGFASLQQLRPRLTELLHDVPDGLSLEGDAATPEVLDRVARLFSVLDETSRNAVAVYRGRYPDFPVPAVERGQCRLWLQQDIRSWLAGRK